MNAQPGETAREPAIQARGITKAYRRETAVDDITLDVNAGEIFGVLGPDGSGKTTLMQIFAAILDPTGGNCRVLGFDTVEEDASINAQVGYLSQGFTLYDRLSVDENLAFAARIRGVTEGELRQRAKRLLGMAGLAQFRDRRARDLSGGMRKKLSLCAALVHQPPLLLLDEMSLGVDPLSRRELWEMLQTFRDEGITIVLTTPYMDEAEYCDRLGFINRGRLIAVDQPEALRASARGHTFEIEAAGTSRTLAALTEIPGVLNVRRIANRLRFQLREAKGPTWRIDDGLPELGMAAAVEPSLEDAFVLLTQRTPSSEAQLPSATARLAPQEPAGVAGQPAIDVRNVTCTFGDFVAVNDVSLTVDQGEILGFLGPNGAGKTTLIRTVCGLLRPTAGEISVAGVDVRKNPRRVAQHIGYMSQRFSLYPDMTSSENLSFFGGAYGLRGSDKREALQRASALVGLHGMLDRKANDLSGAVRQRLALACSILHSPKVLFLDEPTSGVDPLARNRFWRLIQTLAESGMTVFVTTHYLEEAHYCDRIGLMARGRLLAVGAIERLRDDIGAPENATTEEIFVRYVRRALDEVETAAV